MPRAAIAPGEKFVLACEGIHTLAIGNHERGVRPGEFGLERVSPSRRFAEPELRANTGVDFPMSDHPEDLKRARQSGRGREAETPSEIPAKGWADILWRVWEEFSEDRIPLVAGGLPSTSCSRFFRRSQPSFRSTASLPIQLQSRSILRF